MTWDGDNLRPVSDRVSRAYKARTERQSASFKWFRVLVIIGGSAAAGLAQFLALPAGPMPPANVVGIAATLIVGVAGLFQAIVEKDTFEELETARVTLQEAQSLQRQLSWFEEFLADTRRSVELYQSIRDMRSIIEMTFFATFDEKTAVASMLKAASRSLPLAFGFALEDHWTVCVYKEIQGELVCVAHLRAVDCLLDNARKWPVGVGITGIAFARGTEVIVPDLAAPELGTLHHIPTQKDEDVRRYRSIIGVPILLGPQNRKWGMAVATSSVAGHFSLDPAMGMKATEAARALGAMIALLLSAHNPSRP